VGGRRPLAAVVVIGLLALTAVVAVVLLSGSEPVAATTTGPPVIGPTTATDPLAGFPTTTVVVGGQVWLVAVADEHHERVQGLMSVTDLGDLDGMLFVWDEDSVDPFWMKDTPLPLDLALFAVDGTLIELLSMTPCPAEPCPVYGSAVPFRYALEAPRGAFDGIGVPFLQAEG